MELFRIEMNEKDCFRSVPIRNVPLHRQEIYTYNYVNVNIYSYIYSYIYTGWGPQV